MNTYIVYCDETGDDGLNTKSSNVFILTSLYMPASSWQKNFNIMKSCRKTLKNKYGFHISQEMHTKNFLSDKGEYRNYNWSNEQKKEILNYFSASITRMDLSIVNVIIDKNNIATNNYPILENALKYNIQRIENTLSDDCNFLMITDQGRIGPMRKTARAIRAFNPIQSQIPGYGYRNIPIKHMIEDIMEKNSKESYFIQICDFVSYFVNLYYRIQYKHSGLPNRVGHLITEEDVISMMNFLNKKNRFNLKASTNEYGLVIYPK